MAGKSRIPLVAGTDNVVDLEKYRARKILDSYRNAYVDEFPWTELNETLKVEDSGPFMHFDASDFDRSINAGYQPIEGKNILGHHERMMKATEELRRKASWQKTTKSPDPTSA